MRSLLAQGCTCDLLAPGVGAQTGDDPISCPQHALLCVNSCSTPYFREVNERSCQLWAI